MFFEVYEYTRIVERGTQACGRSVSGLRELIFQRRLFLLFPLIVGRRILLFFHVSVNSKGEQIKGEVLQVPNRLCRACRAASANRGKQLLEVLPT